MDGKNEISRQKFELRYFLPYTLENRIDCLETSIGSLWLGPGCFQVYMDERVGGDLGKSSGYVFVLAGISGEICAEI